MTSSFRIRNRTVGAGHPAYIVAEAGSNHDGRPDVAHQLIDAAAAAGVDAVKFQLFEARRLYPRNAGRSAYLGRPTPIYDIIAAMEMPAEWLSPLRDHAHEAGLAFIVSPFHEEAVELLAPYVDAFKIASYELTHEPLLRAVARHGKPVILSTGASDLEETRRALQSLRCAGCSAIAVLQCTAAYPAPPDTANVRAVVTLRDMLGVPTGLSDHTRDPTAAPAAAAALGAAILEKHFTLSNDREGPDHRFALEADELRRMVNVVRSVEAVLGSGEKLVEPVEHELRAFGRRSIFATRSIKAGERFSRDNVDVLRNGEHASGLPPSEFERVLGGRAARDVAALTPLTEEDLTTVSLRTAEGDLLLRPAQMADAELLFDWANDPATREASFHSAPIAWEEHLAWCTASIIGGVRLLLIAQRSGGGAIGVVRFDPERAADVREVSLTVAPEHRGRGHASRLLALATDHARASGVHVLTARIRPSNVRSIRAFEAAGYRLARHDAVAGQPALCYALDTSVESAVETGSRHAG